VSALRGFVERMLASGRIATLFAFSGQMANSCPKDVRARFVMDFGDVDSAKFESYGAEGGAMAPIHRREGRVLAAFERSVAARADISLFVSDAEADLFRRRSGLDGSDIRVLQNGVDLEYYDPQARFPALEERGPLIVFTGQMDYAPNIDAVRWFAGEVMPMLPKARFAIVGRKPPEAVRRLAGPRTIVTARCRTSAPGWPPPTSSRRRSASPAESRTRCSRRWRWLGRSSLRRRRSKASRPSRDFICSSPTARRRRRRRLRAFSMTANARKRWGRGRAAGWSRCIAGKRGWGALGEIAGIPPRQAAA
jgi:hypothetical protein